MKLNNEHKKLIARLDLAATNNQVIEYQTKVKKMSKEKIYPKGIITFDKREGAPDFVLGAVVITPNDLIEWLKEHDQYKSEYNGKTQFRFQLLSGDKGPYLVLDTYKPQEKPVENKESDLPF